MGDILVVFAGMGAVISVISEVFRNLFFFIDSIIYALIPCVYRLIYSLYDITTIINEDALQTLLNNFTETVYSFLAIFMFFRIAFSLIVMLVDPSSIDDKEKGAKKIVTNVMICLVLIVAVPIIFDYAKQIQSRVLEDNLIEKVVIGDNFKGDDEAVFDLGNELSLSVLSVFLYPIEGADSDTKAAYDNVFVHKNANLITLQFHLDSITGNGIIGKLSNFFQGKTAYSLSYVFLLSTIVGAYVLWTFIQMMVDVAYRSIKFVALELLSPIAIVSYIDPSSSKKGVFSKWLNETIKTYISLFVRIFVFAFASVLLNSIDMSAVRDEKFITYLFFILAIVAFLKTAPKFIDNLFGTSISKDSESNLANGLKSVLGFAGMATGVAAGGISNAVVAKKAGKTGWGVFGAGIKGAFSGGKKGFDAGKKGGFGGMVGVVSNAYGTYGDAKKAYGLNIDPEMDKLVEKWEKRVPEVDAAKKATIADLDANNGAKRKEILRKGTTVNGRHYGQGLENDDGFENLIKKTYGGLAADEIKHADDQDYLILRRAVAAKKEADAIMQRTSALANAQYKSAEAAYNSASDRESYLVSFEIGTAKTNYAELNAVELKNVLQNEYNNLIRNVSDEGQRQKLKVDFDARMSRFDSSDNKLGIVLEQTKDRIIFETAELSASELDARFDKANEARIISVYGNSLANIESDAGKVSGEVSDAQKALDNYVNGKGKKAKDIDSAYALADSRYKAKELEKKRREELEKQKNNNS